MWFGFAPPTPPPLSTGHCCLHLHFLGTGLLLHLSCYYRYIIMMVLSLMIAADKVRKDSLCFIVRD